VFWVSLPGIPISLGIWVWGYPKHGDTQITVTAAVYDRVGSAGRFVVSLSPVKVNLVDYLGQSAGVVRRVVRRVVRGLGVSVFNSPVEQQAPKPAKSLGYTAQKPQNMY